MPDTITSIVPICLTDTSGQVLTVTTAVAPTKVNPAFIAFVDEDGFILDGSGVATTNKVSQFTYATLVTNDGTVITTGAGASTTKYSNIKFANASYPSIVSNPMFVCLTDSSGVTVGGDSGGGATINAPVLSLSSNTTYPPPLVISGDETATVGVDSLQVQSSATADFASPIINQTILLPASGSSITVPGLSSISSPTQTYFRARIVPPTGSPSAWSALVKHGDTVAPTITSANSFTAPEEATYDFALTANEDIQAWTVIGGLSASIVSGNILRLAAQSFETTPSGTVTVRATDYGGNSTDQIITVTITDVDEIANAFTFTDVTGVSVSSTQTSNTITIAGLASGVSVPVTVTGGAYSKNGGEFVSTAGTAVNGDTFAVRGTASASEGTSTFVVLSVGTVSDSYAIQTVGTPVATTTFHTSNGTNKWSNVVVSGAGLVVSNTDANNSWGGVRTTQQPQADVTQFEVTLTDIGTSFPYIFIEDGTTNLGASDDTKPVTGTNGVEIQFSDAFDIAVRGASGGDAYFATSEGANDGDILSIEITKSTGRIRIWFTRGGTTTLVVDKNKVLSNYFISCHPRSLDVFTFNFGQSPFTKAMDSGVVFYG